MSTLFNTRNFFVAVDYLSQPEVVSDTVIGCGMLDGINPSTIGNSPFFTFADVVTSGSHWYFSYWLMTKFTDRFTVSQRWFALVPVFSMMSVVYRKYTQITKPKPNKEDQGDTSGKLVNFEKRPDGTFALSIGGRSVL